jgi:hypothetical protein
MPHPGVDCTEVVSFGRCLISLLDLALEFYKHRWEFSYLNIRECLRLPQALRI